jgi:putative tryptophan/tyrosine transport system substrate-binding protein
MRMRRRDFVIGVAGAAAWPRTVLAQRSDRQRRVGVMLLFAETDPEPQARVMAFGEELKTLGWRNGDNVRIEYRFAAGNFDRMRAFAMEFLESKPDVIVTNTYQSIISVQWDRMIPVVLAMVLDPVETGLVNSLSNPAENVTGFTTFDSSIVGKWLELLKVVKPSTSRVGFISNPDALSPPYQGVWLRQFESAASLASVKPIPVSVHDLTQMRNAMATLGRESGTGLLIMPDTFTVGNYPHIVGAALQHGLAGCYPYRYFAAEGGLMSYGPDGVHVFRQAASYVDRILRGAKPSELPLQRPTKFEFVINLKTAKALNLDVPHKLLIRADEIIR